jgi:hypothetical protein
MLQYTKSIHEIKWGFHIPIINMLINKSGKNIPFKIAQKIQRRNLMEGK